MERPHQILALALNRALTIAQVSLPQYIVMTTVKNHPGQPPSGVAEKNSMSTQTVMNQVRTTPYFSLGKDRYDPIRLTADGEAKLARVEELIDRDLKRQPAAV
jgi:DNA-binding MarR family transcriptional regulator